MLPDDIDFAERTVKAQQRLIDYYKERSTKAEAEVARLREQITFLESNLADADQVTQDALAHARAATLHETMRLREVLGDVGEWYVHDFDDRPYDLGKAIREKWPGLLAERVTCGACGGEGEIGDSVCSTCSGRGGVLVSPPAEQVDVPHRHEWGTEPENEGGYRCRVCGLLRPPPPAEQVKGPVEEIAEKMATLGLICGTVVEVDEDGKEID